MINVLKRIFVETEVQEVPPRPVPPRDLFIPEFNEVFNCVQNEIKKSHYRKIGRSRGKRS